MNAKRLAAVLFAAGSMAVPMSAAMLLPIPGAELAAASRVVEAAASVAEEVGLEEAPAPQMPDAATKAACVGTPTTLCLNKGRFAVTAAYRTSAGATGNGTGVALTSDSGYFWFFNAANIEVVVKVLNACSQAPPRYWVFAAGLTNVEVTLTVTDTQAGGAPKVYTNPINTPFQPIQDVSAFSTCP